MRRHALLVLAAAAWLLLPARAQQPVIELAAADWPPYSIAGDPRRPGIADEQLRAVFARLGWTLRVRHLPWSRAVHEARDGRRVQGLLTAVPAEAQGLLLTRSPSFHYEVGLYTRTDSRWQYRDAGSLREIKLGVVAAYGYGSPLDEHLADPAQAEHVLRLSGDDTVVRLLALLQIQRIDAFAEDRAVLQWTALRRGVAESSWREAGRLPPQPVYLALNPKLPGVQALLAQLNAELALPRSRADFERLRRRYLDPASAATAGSAGSGS